MPDSVHQGLFENPDGMFEVYDRAAQELIEAIRPEGYFEGFSEEDLTWPKGGAEDLKEPALKKRRDLVEALYNGIPQLRDDRLGEAFEQFESLAGSYHKGNRIYLQLKDQFISKNAGTAQEFLKLYQTLYVDALAKGDEYVMDVGEASLVEARISRAPLSHAQAVAEALSKVTLEDDPKWLETYSYSFDGESTEGILRDLLRDVAQRTLDYIAAGELLSTRFNAYSNMGWFGGAVWKVVTDAEWLLLRIGDAQGETEGLVTAQSNVRLTQCMLVEFFQAHREDPTQLRPENYWYWQPYAYLTRDMIDLSRNLVEKVNQMLLSTGLGLPEMVLPKVLGGNPTGRFVEFPRVGKIRTISSFARKMRFLRWIRPCWKVGRSRLRLLQSEMAAEEKYRLAWEKWREWSEETKRIFEIKVDIIIDPEFKAVSRALDLGSGKHKVLILPTHQSLMENLIHFPVFQSDEFLDAMGWDSPVPFAILARTGLFSTTSLRLGPWELSMFGVSPKTNDVLFEVVDGYVTRESLDGTAHTTSKILDAMENRPGLIYPTGTTASFAEQLIPLQHALFSKLPQDIVIIPVVFRGTHSVWPRCPKGNLDINPGVIEAVICPPMLGETTLLPKRRSLRIQAETAALFQAVHIASLLNPDTA